MPTGLRGGSSGGSGGLTPPRNFGTGTANQTASQAGKVVFGLSNPSETMVNSAGNLTAGFIGVGKGLVSLAENLPVVGAVAKPLIGFAGGIADATIGRGVSALEQIKVGDKNLAQLAVGALETVGDVTVKPAIDILSAPGRFVEQKTAEARILNTKDKRNDIITLLFGNAPASALNSIRAGATVEEAALELANSNAGFSESGAMNFLYSLVLDPMNLILPGVGKVGSIAKQASHLNKITKAALTAEEAAFVEKWSFAGKIYENTLGKASEITKRFSTNIVKEAALGWTRVYDVKAVGGVVDDIERVIGREVADRMLNNYAATFYNGIKSAAVRTSAARYRSWAEDFSDNVVNDLITAARETGSAATALRQQAGVADTIGSLLVKAKMNQKQIDELVAVIDEKIGRKVRNDEILKSSDIIRIKEELSRLQNNILVEGDKNVILEMAKYRTGANARYASDDAIRLFREDKMSEIPVARDPQAALKQLTEHISAGAGITIEEAAEIAARQLAAAKGDIRKITDILAFAKGSAFGQAMRETATIRSLFDEADDFSRLTIISGRSLTKREVTAYRARVAELKGRLKAAMDAKDEVASKAVKEEMRALSDELVSKYDEFSSRFANDTFTYDQVFKHLDDSDDLTVMELTSKDLAKIAAGKTTELKQLGDLQRRLEAYGYRLGISPKSGLVQKTKTLVADRYGREKFVEISAPFVDTLDHLDVTTKFSGKVDTAIAAAKSRPSTLGRVWEAFTRPYGSEITKSNIAERFVTNMVAKTGISVNQAREIMSRVNSLAAQLNRKPQALFMERSLVDEIFRDVMRDNYGRLASAGTYPVKEILEAAAGDWSVAGLTSGFTGRVKAWRPEITILTDILYPDVRFGKLNPYFNLVMERVETNIQLRVHGIKKEFARESLGDVATGAGVRGSAARKAYLSNANVNREINDAVLDTLTSASVRNLTYAANGSTAFANRVRQTLAKYSSIDRVRFNKDIARNIMADKFAAREFIDILEQVAPGKLNELAIHFGVKKADEVVELLLSEYLIQADPVRFAKHVKDLGPSARGISVKTLVESGMDTKQAEELVGAVVGAYEAAILRGSRIADKAQYFASQRSWFERSINHPFLALYPYSYMVQKAIPSLMRVMFAPRILGEVAPMLGILKWEQAQEYMQNQLNTDKDVIGQVLSNDALLWMLTTILPTTPDSSGFSMPAWMRRGLAQPALKGEDITLGSFAPTLTEAGSTLVRGSVLGQIRSTLEGIQEATDIVSGEIKKNILDELGSDIRNP